MPDDLTKLKNSIHNLSTLPFTYMLSEDLQVKARAAKETVLASNDKLTVLQYLGRATYEETYGVVAGIAAAAPLNEPFQNIFMHLRYKVDSAQPDVFLTETQKTILEDFRCELRSIQMDLGEKGVEILQTRLTK